MKIKIRGKWFTVQDSKMRTCDGQVDSKKRLIRIDPRLRDKEMLRVTIHELLHACFWDIDEGAVDDASASMADALWKMGWKQESA